MVYKRKKYHYGDTHLKKQWRTKRRKRDLDEINEDLEEKNAEKLLKQETDVDKPGQAQFYCIHCARYFINDHALKDHFRTKVHKRRMKALELEPYSIEDSERCAGQGSFKLPQKRKIETQPNKEELEKDPSSVKKLKTESIHSVSSALFISGEKAQETFAILNPYIDFDEQLKNKKKIVENIKLRDLNINLDEVISVWIFYKKFQLKRSELEQSKLNIAKTIKSLSPEKDKKEIDKLITLGRMIKDDLKALRESYYSLEENAIMKFLSLPNILHERTPITSKIIHDKSNLKIKSEHHLKISEKLGLIEFNNNSNYYLKKDAALFELASTFFLTDKLLQKNYTEFSNSDFTRSVVIEGCGIDYSDPKQVFTIMEHDLDTKHENSRLHLSGGSSLPSFMAYFTKHTVFANHLPLKLFTIGRKYSPSNTNEFSLFNVTQETCLDVFIATKDDINEMNLEIDNLIKDIIDIYEMLGYDFRLSYVSAKDLKNYESLRVRIEMFSCFLQEYVEVGYVSALDSFASKRLLFNYGSGYNMNFPKVLSGTLFSVPKVLACILENKYTLLHNEFIKYIS